MANVGLPHYTAREVIALAIHVVVHLARSDGRRPVTEVLAIRSYDAATERFTCVPLREEAPSSAS